MNISELNKERLTIRKTNPVRATVLNLLVDGVSKLAKQENREVEDKDFYTVATRSVKEIERYSASYRQQSKYTGTNKRIRNLERVSSKTYEQRRSIHLAF